MATRAVLDSDIWDRLAADDQGREPLRDFVNEGRLEVLVPDTVVQELEKNPFGGIPPWFQTNVTTDSVFVLDHSRLGHARIGGGGVFTPHRGESQHTSDAIIVDSADNDADIFVSEDRRSRERYARLRDYGRAFDYVRFRREILNL